MTPELSPDNTALIVVDMSLDFLQVGAPFETVEGRDMLPDLTRFIRHCRDIELPIIYLNHVHQPGANDKGTLAERFPVIRDGKAVRAGTEGVTIWPEIAPQSGDIVIEKIRQSGFMYTRLDATLRELKIVNVLMSGVSTGACVESTARDAVSRDYTVYMLSDVTAASGIADQGWGAVDSATLQKVFLTNFARHFGKVVSTGELMAGPLNMKMSPGKSTETSNIC